MKFRMQNYYEANKKVSADSFKLTCFPHFQSGPRITRVPTPSNIKRPLRLFDDEGNSISNQFSVTISSNVMRKKILVCEIVSTENTKTKLHQF